MFGLDCLTMSIDRFTRLAAIAGLLAASGCCMHHPAQTPLPLAQVGAAGAPTATDQHLSLADLVSQTVGEVLTEQSVDSADPERRSTDGQSSDRSQSPTTKTVAYQEPTELTIIQPADPVEGEIVLEGPEFSGPVVQQTVPLGQGSCCADGSVGTYPGSCGTCRRGSGGGLSGIVLPLLSTRLACGSGCGSMYWSEWIADPPSPCDPCDDNGCWVEPQGFHPYQNPHGGPILRTLGRVKRSIHHILRASLYGYGQVH